jgi:ribonuclease E
MSKEIYISSTPHETRLAIVEKDELTEIYYERENEYTLAGSIYNGKVTRVLPGMQSSFVDIGLERDAFLYITDFLEEAGETDDVDTTDTNGAKSSEGNGRSSGRSRGRGRDRKPQSAEGSEGSETHSSEDEGLDAAPRDGDEVGEGAPGADGSRRWRGRRGRRRGGRADGQPGSAESSAQPAEAERTSEPREPRPDRAPRDRGDRGGRERDRGRGRNEGRSEGSRTEGGRDDRGRHEQIRERFAPRSTSRYSSDESTDISASAEPFLLPGESLSKYRRGEEAAASSGAESKAFAPTPVLVTRPSTEVVLTGWDGGSVLPGETLSRRSGASSENPSRPAGDRDRGDRDRGGRGGRDRGRGRGRDRSDSSDSSNSKNPQRFSSTPRLDPAEAVLPAVTSQHEVASEGTFSDDAPQFEVQQTEQRLEAEHAAHAHEVEAAQHESIVEFHETTTEYEPADEASASFRVDPAGPSEFRQSSVIEETVDEPTQPEHEFTAVQPTGEMISEQVPALENPASPIQHQAAVQSVTLAEAAVEAEPADSSLFAPGVGELEEELLDDEESELPRVHAVHTQEDTEEETLENAADLGSMLRDMSIDDIVRPEPAEGDEDEEDDFEDDEELEEDELAVTDEAEYEEDEESAEGDDLSSADISEAEEEEFAEGESLGVADPAANGEQRERAPRDDARRGRRGSRDRGNRDRGSRSSGGGDRRPNRSRHSVQATNLPAISDLLKPGQEVLVQIAKEPIAKKGARITSHIALPGRFLVFMPTVSHTGVSRKIESDAERRRLKEILLSEKGGASGGFIVRTAASGASEEELRSDLRFLLNLWTEIKTRSDSSKSPALIYHDLNLIERILRDQVTDNFSAIWVDTEAEYERVLRFLQRFQPSLIRRVKLYTKETPLFEQFGITEEINKALRAKVWLKSGGSIVINQTEALVAIDINTGKFVGKTTKLEDTILKTNLDAIPEIVRQIRLRDLGGIIIIDFIDMDERRNRNKVMAALEDELKKDRAPSKVLQFNDFGLVAITRKRVKQSLERTLSTTCGICTGTGMVKSPVTVCNEIYIELRKMHKHLEKGDIMLRVNPEVVKQLKSNGGKWLQEMEELSGKTILVKSDPTLHPEQYDIH